MVTSTAVEQLADFATFINDVASSLIVFYAAPGTSRSPLKDAKGFHKWVPVLQNWAQLIDTRTIAGPSNTVANLNSLPGSLRRGQRSS